ncbi:DUF6090 family protein [Psychroserpens sp.]|uniref:DUF6090 family protein n=1 Tax=Psychroserpens sp. TaxID=2020870 RepID=UPI002B266168|nr:DUF6090 family protein [Psychroserpens sp.]
MIKFFRKIRYDLMGKNKTGKYLKYAIGEIVLVVLGILIALQLNNYNDTLKQHKQEQKILQNLKLDFDYNLSELERNIQNLKNNKKAGLKIISQTGNKISNNFSIDSLIDQITFTPVYFPQNGFLLELVNSGKLGIISNETLRNRLSSWFPTLETLHDREQIALEYNRHLVLYIIKNGSWLNADKMSTDQQIRAIDFPASGFDIDNNEMLKSSEFENFVENQIVNQTILLGRQEKCINLNKEIIELLDIEIKK